MLTNLQEIKLRKYIDTDGILTCMESNKEIPFEVKRIFLIKNVPINGVRGNHAVKMAKFFFVLLQGNVSLEIDDGKNIRKYELSLDEAILIDEVLWFKFYNFSPNTILMILSDSLYHSSNYIKEYSEFRRLKRMEKEDHVKL